ncbi:hypothetical protein D3C75_1227660 [compost metagenome]
MSCSAMAIRPILFSFQPKLRATSPEAPIPVRITRRAARSMPTLSSSFSSLFTSSVACIAATFSLISFSPTRRIGSSPRI